MKKNPALFLDLDGVAHPAGCDRREYMCRMNHLLDLVRRLPKLEIVISSSWRKTLTIEKIRSFFYPEIADRIVGMTPVITPKPEKYGRYLEIQQYLREHPYDRWIALDDNSKLFPPGCDHLIKVNGKQGLDETTVSQINFKLKIMKSAPPTSYAMD